MGMNYFLVKDACSKCGGCSDRQHIGKSSVGWQFHFRGYRDEDIYCFLDWKNLFQKDIYSIEDEFGRKISVEEFLELVEAKKPGLNHWNILHRQPMTEAERSSLADRPLRGYNPPLDGDCWKDDNGYAFTDREFS